MSLCLRIIVWSVFSHLKEEYERLISKYSRNCYLCFALKERGSSQCIRRKEKTHLRDVQSLLQDVKYYCIFLTLFVDVNINVNTIHIDIHMY